MARKKKAGEIKDLNFPDLVDIVRSKGRINKNKINAAYNEIETRMKSKLMKMVNQFYIPGCNSDDIYQEVSFALRYKAIPDFDKTKIGRNGPYPFDKFAILCIRRHLATLLKSSYQNKRKTLNTSVSLDQDRNTSSDDVLFLSDIIPRTDVTVIESIEQKEYHNNLFGDLYGNLSKFEKKVFILYAHRYSYEEMTDIINKDNKRKGEKGKVKVKSIDNALSRIKQKGKFVFDKYQEG